MRISGSKRFLAAIGAALFLLAIPISQASADKRDEARELKGTIASLSASLNKAAARHQAAQEKLYTIMEEIAEARHRLAIQKARLRRQQRDLNGRIKGIYRNGDINFVEVVLGAKTFDEFLVRWEFLRRVGQADAKLLSRIKRLKRQIEQSYATLRVKKREQAAVTAKLDKIRGEISGKLQEQQQMYEQVKAEIARMAELARQRRSQIAASSSGGGSSGGTVAVTGDWAFPVAGPHAYSDDFGDPRSGGRSHQGCDIMASMGTPVVAVVSGSASIRENGLGGKCIWLSGNDGNEYYYAHLSGYASTGSVRIGQIIGYVGDSGNAAGTPHLHFEIHPGGGGAINPYPILRAHDN